MSHILISLVSEQTIPNVLFIKEFRSKVKFDEYLFITTKKMEESESLTDLISQATQLPHEDCRKIRVNPDSYKDIKATISSEINLQTGDRHWVNLTGGNKLMALAVFDFFKHSTAKVYYMPVHSNRIEQILPEDELKEYTIQSSLNIQEYLNSYGLTMQEESSEPGDINESTALMKKVMAADNDVSKIPEIAGAQHKPESEHRAFYSGGWFEDYIYFKIKEHFGLKKKKISLNAKVKNFQVGNEYDILFLDNNRLYAVECKAYFGKPTKEKFEKDLYKLAALKTELGLTTQPVFITTYNFKNNKLLLDNLKLRARELGGIKVFTAEELKNDLFLTKITMNG